MDQSEAIGLIKGYIAFLIEKKHYAIKEAILFGSYVRGGQHEDSDIDIALVIENLGDNFDEGLNLMRHCRGFDVRIEPHPFDASKFYEGHHLTAEILKTGIKIL